MSAVLAPGFGLSAASWRPFLSALPRGLLPTALALELPGHGARSDELRTDALDDARTWFNELEVVLDSSNRPAVLFAFSFSTALLAHRLMRGTPRLAGCVLLGGAPGPGTFSAAYRAIGDDVGRGARRADCRLVELSANTCAGRDAMARDLARVPVWARRAAAALPRVEPPRIDAPTLTVFGELDAIAVAPTARRMADLAPGGTFATLAGAGHAVHLDAPEALASLVADVVGEWV